MGSIKSGYVLNNGNPLNYLEWGDGNAPPLVLIHGVRGFAYSWRPVAERLADRYRCLALNLRGHGDSGPSPEGEYTYPLFVTDVHALLTQLEIESCTIIGYSLGGRTAIAYAGTHPEHTRAIVVVDHGPGLSDEAAEGVKRAMEATPPEFDSWSEAVAFLARFPGRREASAVAERAFYAFRRLPNGKTVWKADPFLRDEWLGPDLPPRARADVWPELQKLQCPMLLVKGEDSPFLTPEPADQMASHGAGSRWVEIPDTTHFVYDDNLDGFMKELEPFLAEVVAFAR